MTEHAHRWKIENYEYGILKGFCRGCGAVRFYPEAITDKALVQRCEELNKEHGHEFNFPKQTVTGVGIEAMQRINKETRKPKKKEEMMFTQPVIPVKVPDTNGLNHQQKGQLLKKFYEAHKEEIIEDLEKIGKETTRKRWQIPSQTFLNLRRAWGLPIDGHYAHRKAAKPAENMTKNMPEMKPDNNEIINATAVRIKIESGDEKKLPITPLLPSFPPFDSSWKESVQVEWLRIYGLIAAEAK